MKRNICAILLVITLLLAGCSSTTQGAAQSEGTVPPASFQNCEEAQEYLDKIFVSFTPAYPESSVKASGGISLPYDLSEEFFSITAVGKFSEEDSEVDLMKDKMLEPGHWLVFEDLENYSRVDVTMTIRSATFTAERTFDLLAITE